jgi:hypothetical protein
MNKVLLELHLLERIDGMKKKLVEVVNNTGINSNQTITCSQELDNLLNLHMKSFTRIISISAS